MREAGFANRIILIVILTIIVGGGLIVKSKPNLYNNNTDKSYSTKTLNESTQRKEDYYSEWKTFYSETYDIIFKYPEGWEATEGRINHLGIENKDVIPCGETWGEYFKNHKDCKTLEVAAPYIEIYKLEPETQSETNNITFSVMQFSNQMGTNEYFEKDSFDLTEKTITIDNQNLIQTSFSGFTTPAYNKGFQVNGIATGDKSVFSKLNVFAASRPTKPEYSELETLEKILYSIKINNANN